jgi:hypothetical protein
VSPILKQFSVFVLKMFLTYVYCSGNHYPFAFYWYQIAKFSECGNGPGDPVVGILSSSPYYFLLQREQRNR